MGVPGPSRLRSPTGSAPVACGRNGNNLRTTMLRAPTDHERFGDHTPYLMGFFPGIE
jgi:hypothetical protein